MTRRNKYNAKPTVVDGVRFASKAEAARDCDLQHLGLAGEVRKIKRQPRFPLVVNGVKVGTYVADWEYEERVTANTWVRVVDDKKGHQTREFKLKWKLAQALYPSVNVWRLS